MDAPEVEICTTISTVSPTFANLYSMSKIAAFVAPFQSAAVIKEVTLSQLYVIELAILH